MSPVTLRKHHGLGNDFLVALDLEGRLVHTDLADLARHACDRRRGIGADGLIVASAPDGMPDIDVVMELHNANGSRAEMSGNGIRCLAQAVLDTGIVSGDEVRVATDVGARVVRCMDRAKSHVMELAVDMGPTTVMGSDDRFLRGSVKATALVSTGNPHLVLLGPTLASLDIATEGPQIEAVFPEGINIEWIQPGPEPDALTLRVWERGVGATEACGTGSCAAATAAHAWGVLGRTVLVHNPGGDVVVELGSTTILIGPATRVATLEFAWP